MNPPYAGARVRRSLWHFLLGKGLSSLAGIAGMVLVVRALSIADFAAYSVLIALVEILTAVTGLGLSHLILRYVPELYATGSMQALRGLVWPSFLLRTGLLALLLLAAAAFADPLSHLLGVGSAANEVFLWFLPLLLVRIAGHFLSQCLESTLHQSLAQTGFTLAAVLRLLLLLYFAWQGDTDIGLKQVVWAELLGDVVGVLIMAWGTFLVLRRGQGELPASWAWINRHKLYRFARSGYLQHLAILPYGGHANRLLGAQVLQFGALAAFGFAQSLYEYVKRYLPAQLLVGLIRPIVVARFAQSADFSRSAYLCQLVLQINLLLLAVLTLPILVSGPELLLAISAQKYGAESAWILLGLYVVLALETQRQQLELLAQTIERYELLLPTNALLSLSVLLGLVLVPVLGPAGFPLGNAVGLLFANAQVKRSLNSLQRYFEHDFLSTFTTLGLLSLSVAAGWMLRALGLQWWWALLISLALFLGFAWTAQRHTLLAFYRELTKGPQALFDGPLDVALPTSVTPCFVLMTGLERDEVEVEQLNEIATSVAPYTLWVASSDVPSREALAPNVQTVESGSPREPRKDRLAALLAAASRDPNWSHLQMLDLKCRPTQTLDEFRAFLEQERPSLIADIDHLGAARLGRPGSADALSLARGCTAFRLDGLLPVLQHRFTDPWACSPSQSLQSLYCRLARPWLNAQELRMLSLGLPPSISPSLHFTLDRRLVTAFLQTLARVPAWNLGVRLGVRSERILYPSVLQYLRRELDIAIHPARVATTEFDEAGPEPRRGFLASRGP